MSQIIEYSVRSLAYRNYALKNIFVSSVHQDNLTKFRKYCSGTKNCWKCGHDRTESAIFCEKCESIQKPLNKNNYFKVFQLNESFSIDQKMLSNKYRQMQSVLHPDKFSNKSSEEKEISDEYSSLVNKAYNKLQLPISRAVHLLNLKGAKLEEDEKIQEPSFLMEIMEKNEEIDEADTEEKIRTLDLKNKEIIKEYTERISKCFDEANVDKAKENVIKMKYYDSMNKRIQSLLREKGIVD